ncbi:phosphate ABC transporter permease [Crocosphaera sp. UHCC 0190]|uniref:phosphate ABC transporter permease n=1 Tax=Crocosphaera sp. UHCC 0190 TaxID=3110246 RepID=UPI002B1EB25B|nr:phosphate ABC transporter permease [Crocosphaera sp. UHCC 0190]MEA5509115.1 phosphate ABC transporter permease [Crocosphaera sp. UHCC 0190]
MLVPLTREAFEKIIPPIATGAQYSFYWGKLSDLLRRLFISLIVLVVTWLLGTLAGAGAEAIKLIFDIIAGLYWLWSPVLWASVRNGKYRRYPYCGFWRGEVLDVFITEELISEEQTVNKWGELVVIENRERRINVEVGDQKGFSATVQAPIRRLYRVIKPGQIAEMLILSKQPDLSRIDKVTDVYLPQHNLWVGDYPYLRRDVFLQVSEELGGNVRDGQTRGVKTREIRRRRR